MGPGTSAAACVPRRGGCLAAVNEFTPRSARDAVRRALSARLKACLQPGLDAKKRCARALEAEHVNCRYDLQRRTPWLRDRWKSKQLRRRPVSCFE